MIKRLVFLLLSCIITFSMAGCGTSGNSETEEDDTPAVEETSKIDVEVWVHNYEPLNNWLESKAEQYNQENEKVNVIIRPVTSIQEKVYTSVRAGSGPAIFDFICTSYETLMKKDMIAPVDWETMGYTSAEDFASSWYPTAIEGVHEDDGQYYTLPYTGNTWSLFINTEHFKNAGLDPEKDAPKTWEDVARVAEKLTIRDENGNIIQKGFGMPYNRGWWFYVWGPVLLQAGGNVVSADGTKATINEPEAVESLQVFYDLVHTYKVTEPGAVDEQADFLDGKSSMWVSGIWTKNVMGGHVIENNYAAIPLPQIDPQNPRTVIAGYWWHVSNKVDSKVQKEAWKFLDYITKDPGNQFNATGLLMPKPSIMESQAWKDYPYSDVFAIDLAAGEWPVSSPIYPQIEKAVNDALERSLVGDMSPQESLDIAAEQINQALAEQ